MKFWKLHGIGNDFVAIDGRYDNIDNNDYGEYAKRACHRKFSAKVTETMPTGISSMTRTRVSMHPIPTSSPTSTTMR